MAVGTVTIKMYMTSEEKARVMSGAAACRMSASAYVRTLALGKQPVSRLDLASMAEVFRLSADLGRLGGLLKMLLANPERLDDMGRAMGKATIDATLVDIRITQDLLKQAVAAFCRKRLTDTESAREGTAT